MTALMVLVTSCATASYAQRPIREMDEVSYVLANHYPQLHTYYMEGLLKVNSIKEVVLPDGTLDYRIKYDYVRFHYRDIRDKLEIVKVYYPELYDMYVNGVIDFNSVYRYVDRNTGEIKLHVSYRRLYDYYYEYYPIYRGVGRIHYAPRRYPMAPRRMQPAPHPSPNPGHGPHIRQGGNRPPQGGYGPGGNHGVRIGGSRPGGGHRR